LKGVVMVLVSK